MDEELLVGGLANQGRVTRRGSAVRRPAPPHAAALHEYFQALADQGFEGAPRPLALTDDGYEELTYISGSVAIPPFPDWALSAQAVESVGRLLRRMHDAAAKIPLPSSGVDWPHEFIDPEGGSVLCHNDVCPENVVFRDGEAYALIDFDFAAPGRPLWDLAYCAWYWVPMLPPAAAAAEGQPGLDTAARLRLLADAYELDEAGRRELPAQFPRILETNRRFNAERIAAGDEVFIQIDAERDPQRWTTSARWLEQNQEAFLSALLA
jgi:hypothetical protein